jgi:uncharacterized membrane protein
MLATTLSAQSLSATRVQSVDLLRGLVMVLMAIDHVRVYSGVPAGSPDVGIFFTRWITHFCAPAFTFFAGTSAFLYGAKVNSKTSLASYLVTRGLLLVVLELTMIRFLWAFHIDYSEFVLAGVIWMLGWCMILLAAMVWLKPRTIGIIGVLIVVGQSGFAYIPGLLPDTARDSFSKVWEFIYPSGFDTFTGIAILYSIVPWIGVMAAGYGFGAILMMEPSRKRKLCLYIGLSATAIFLIAGSIQLLASASPGEMPFLLQLLNQRKYPASLLFLLMTIGPMIALVPIAESLHQGWARILATFGKVPFFYYLMHIPVIHLLALVVQGIKTGHVDHSVYRYAPYVSMPEESRWSLLLLYIVFLIAVAILFFICRWYERYKATHPQQKWTKYL